MLLVTPVQTETSVQISVKIDVVVARVVSRVVAIENVPVANDQNFNILRHGSATRI